MPMPPPSTTPPAVGLGTGDVNRLPPARAAEGYAAAGVPVLPLSTPTADRGCSCPRAGGCGAPGKHPRVPGGVHAATTNLVVVRGWWRRWPDANVGLATGVVFDVCDIDAPDGQVALRDLFDHHGWPEPGPLVRTGGGGWHLLFAPTGWAAPARGGWPRWTGAAAAG